MFWSFVTDQFYIRFGNLLHGYGTLINCTIYRWLTYILMFDYGWGYMHIVRNIRYATIYIYTYIYNIYVLKCIHVCMYIHIPICIPFLFTWFYEVYTNIQQVTYQYMISYFGWINLHLPTILVFTRYCFILDPTFSLSYPVISSISSMIFQWFSIRIAYISVTFWPVVETQATLSRPFNAFGHSGNRAKGRGSESRSST